MTDWRWWQDKLAGKPVEMNPDEPHAGFYRMPRRQHYGARKTYIPVAYWPGEDGQLNCREGDNDVNLERAQAIWHWVGNHAVSEEAYRAVAERGEGWPDEHALVPMGDNLPPADDSFEGLRDAIEPLAKEALQRIEGPPIANQDEADQIANLADALAELWNKADGQRKLERKPHDEELKEIQKKWSPLLVAAESYRNLKYKLLTPWLNKLKAKQEEEAKAAAAAGQPAAAESRRPRAGTRGRAMTLKNQKRAEIVDYAQCLEFFKNSPEVKTAVQDLANRAVRAGIAVPGANVIEESTAV